MDSSLLGTVLKILTPEEIEELAKIYLNYFRKSLTELMDERLLEEQKEKLPDIEIFLSPFKDGKKKARKGIPSRLDEGAKSAGVLFLEEKERFLESFKKQKRLRFSFDKAKRLNWPQKGILVNKKCA
jgi:hypothetical protein